MKHCGEKKFVLSREPDKDKRYRRDSHYRRLVPAGALGAAETVVTGLAGPLPRVVESREKPRPREWERADPVGWLEVTDPSPRAVKRRKDDKRALLYEPPHKLCYSLI